MDMEALFAEMRKAQTGGVDFAAEAAEKREREEKAEREARRAAAGHSGRSTYVPGAILASARGQ